MKQIAWLAMASAMPIDYQDEIFYYDAKEEEFFILTMFDYLLINEDAKRFEFRYSEEVKAKLIEKLNRIDQGDISIIEIERMPLDQRIEFQMQFVEENASGGLQRELIDVVSKQSSNHQLVLDLIIAPQTASEELCDAWEKARITLVQYFVHEFGKTYGTDTLKHITVWEIKESRAVKKLGETLNQYDTENPVHLAASSTPWWKFW